MQGQRLRSSWNHTAMYTSHLCIFMQEKYNIDDFNANLGICMWKHEKEEVEFIKSEEEMLQ